MANFLANVVKTEPLTIQDAVPAFQDENARIRVVLGEYGDYGVAHGYRFLWENPDGAEAPYRTGGYIPSMEYVAELLALARRDGWADIPYRDSF